MTVSVAEQKHKEEIASGERFAFGANWTRFLRLLDEERIDQAKDSLRNMLDVQDLNNKTFLDIGSGSDLFSLAARLLGAKVVSFDYDPQSVACTRELKRRYFEQDKSWRVDSGSVLDPDYLRSLGSFDIVYSWGVLHHTGDMWKALDHIDANVAVNGSLFIALYNYQPLASSYWTFVKRAYNKHPLTRPFFLLTHSIYPTLPRILLRLARNRRYPRGMNIWYDLIDWLGGYPFEVSTPDQVFSHFKRKGYGLSRLKTVGGRSGCYELVFHRQRPSQKNPSVAKLNVEPSGNF